MLKTIKSSNKLYFRKNNSNKLVFEKNHGNNEIIRFNNSDNIKFAKKLKKLKS